MALRFPDQLLCVGPCSHSTGGYSATLFMPLFSLQLLSVKATGSTFEKFLPAAGKCVRNTFNFPLLEEQKHLSTVRIVLQQLMKHNACDPAL